MKKFFIIFLVFYNLLFLIAAWSHSLRFGMGLADVFVPYVYTGFFFIICLYAFFYFQEKSYSKVIFIISTIAVVLILLFFAYAATLGRGPELPWDGRVVF